MIKAVLFDMGGTLEDLFSDAAHEARACAGALEIVKAHGIEIPGNGADAAKHMMEGWKRYFAYRTPAMRELKPEEIWCDYILAEVVPDRAGVAAVAEELANMWERTCFTRKLRPRVAEMLAGLQGMGLKLGIISNTASLFQVYECLGEYGIRDYFQDVTLSSVTGYRKPAENIFKIALHQIQERPADCAYVGDTFSRDVMGAQGAGFGVTFHIKSFLTKDRDKDVPKDVKATYTVEDIYDVYTTMKTLQPS